MNMNYAARQQKLNQILAERKLQAMLVTHLPNVRYLCGFTGSSGVLAVIAADGKAKPKLAFFTDGRYTEQAHAEVHGAKVKIEGRPPLPAAMEWLAKQL